MKRTILSLFLAAITLAAVAQTTVSPQFPGGQEALTKYLHKHMSYPDEAVAYGVEGSVIMRFYVGEDGKVTDISAHDCKIERFNTSKFSEETASRQRELKTLFAKLLAKEAARIIRKMPKWTPGQVDGKAARMQVNQPIKFSMPDK